MAKNAAEEYFIEGLLITRDVPAATMFAATHLSAELGRALPSIQGRAHMRSYAQALGIHFDVLEALIPDVGLTAYDASRICKLVINEPGTVIDIPDSRCIQRHLPTDRSPTLEEIQKAIAACRKS